MSTNAEQYIDIATDIFKRCSGYDLWFPTPSQTAIVAWANVFAESRLSREDLTAGVDLAYGKEGPGYRPLPASIVQYAHAAYFEALRDLSPERRKIMEEANYALQGMGFAPNEAHRYSRAIVLGRKPTIDLTAEQDSELRARITAARDELKSRPPRELESLWNVLPEWKPGREPKRAFPSAPKAEETETTGQDEAA